MINLVRFDKLEIFEQFFNLKVILSRVCLKPNQTIFTQRNSKRNPLLKWHKNLIIFYKVLNNSFVQLELISILQRSILRLSWVPFLWILIWNTSQNRFLLIIIKPYLTINQLTKSNIRFISLTRSLKVQNRQNPKSIWPNTNHIMTLLNLANLTNNLIPDLWNIMVTNRTQFNPLILIINPKLNNRTHHNIFLLFLQKMLPLNSFRLKPLSRQNYTDSFRSHL